MYACNPTVTFIIFKATPKQLKASSFRLLAFPIATYNFNRRLVRSVLILILVIILSNNNLPVISYCQWSNCVWTDCIIQAIFLSPKISFKSHIGRHIPQKLNKKKNMGTVDYFNLKKTFFWSFEKRQRPPPSPADYLWPR